MNHCKECNKSIAYLITKKGKRMPVIWESLSEDEQNQIRNGNDALYEHGRHKSHFIDCPKAKEFRKK